jgi:glycine cleavage system H protein
MAHQYLRPVAARSATAFRQALAPFFQWAKLEGDTVVVGITHHAQEALGDVVFVDLPEVGKTIARGDSFGSVESVKAVSDVYAPVSGEIVEANSELTESHGLVNKSPFDEGWMMKLKEPCDHANLATLSAKGGRCR